MCTLGNNIDNAIDRGGNLLIAGYIQDFVISNSIFLENFAALRTPTCQFSNHVNGKVYNCLFTSNHTLGGGAASAVATGSKVNFINCTFTSNSGGAALTLRNDSHSTLVNNIFWENENYNFILTAVTDSTPCSLNIDYCDIQYGLDSIVVNDTISVINWGLGNIDSDPLFVDILNNDSDDEGIVIKIECDSGTLENVYDEYDNATNAAIFLYYES